MTRLPEAVQAMAARSPEWADWVGRLPALVETLADEWALEAAGPSTHGSASLVVAVRVEGQPAVLKLTFDGDDESEHEHLALRRWAGLGAVRLLRADPRRRALLLERLSDDDLGDAWDVEACEVVARLYGALHVPALPQLRPLSSYVERWLADLAALPVDAAVPRRLVQHAVSAGRGLLADSPDPVVLHGDLHYAHVLAAPGEDGWRAIGPTPVAGDPHYEPAPMLWNRWQELADHPGGVRGGVRDRFHALVDTAGLDEDRARDWVVVRALVNVGRQLHGDTSGRAGPAEREWVTRCLSVAKAVQD